MALALSGEYHVQGTSSVFIINGTAHPSSFLADTRWSPVRYQKISHQKQHTTHRIPPKEAHPTKLKQRLANQHQTQHPIQGLLLFLGSRLSQEHLDGEVIVTTKHSSHKTAIRTRTIPIITLASMKTIHRRLLATRILLPAFLTWIDKDVWTSSIYIYWMKICWRFKELLYFLFLYNVSYLCWKKKKKEKVGILSNSHYCSVKRKVWREGFFATVASLRRRLRRNAFWDWVPPGL